MCVLLPRALPFSFVCLPGVLNACHRGSPIRQPWRHPRGRRPSRAAGSTVDGPRHSREHDQGARDSRRPRPPELVQPRRSRPRRARQGSQHRRRVKAAVRAFPFPTGYRSLLHGLTCIAVDSRMHRRSMRSRRRSSTVSRSARTDMRPTRVPANPGLPATHARVP